jgi:hypothetical protein
MAVRRVAWADTRIKFSDNLIQRMGRRSRLELERQLREVNTKGDDPHKADLGLREYTFAEVWGGAKAMSSNFDCARWSRNPSLESLSQTCSADTVYRDITKRQKRNSRSRRSRGEATVPGRWTMQLLQYRLGFLRLWYHVSNCQILEFWITELFSILFSNYIFILEDYKK